jgi:hypothetical protein
MAKRENQPTSEPLTVGDIFLIPLVNEMLGACRVLRKVGEVPGESAFEAWFVVGCDWIGIEAPHLDELSLRRPLPLTHHYHAAMGRNQFAAVVVAGPVPHDFRRIGSVQPSEYERSLRCPYECNWDALRDTVLTQWRWDHEREAVLAEDAIKAAQFKARHAEVERQRREAVKHMTYAQFREQRLFRDWGPPTPRNMIAASRKLMNETATRLEALGPSPHREAARAVLRDCILGFNRLDEENDHWIETVEREDICSHFYELAHIAGFGDEPELADEWREW